jgi:Flp pilus assembly protein TadD/4-amino-4-deoxy-L-arabinose transferase-like glycosyltransferase
VIAGAVERRANAFIGALVFLVVFAVYAYCVTPTVPYWDSGEYIATSYILGVPHPPGTPLYVLIGRLFSLLPFATVAVRVNLLSSFSAAIAVLFTYLITVRLLRRNFAGETAARPWLAWAGGVVAAFFMAWSPTFWDNAIEAEVYASASAIMCLCVWLALYWWDRQAEPQNDRIIWLILYILFLAIGIHLGTFLVFPCIYLLVTMVHWSRVKKGSFWGSVALFVVAMLLRMMIISQANRAEGIRELTMASEGVRNSAGFFFILMALAVAWNIVAVLGVRFFLGVGALALLGVSVHFYLLIRSQLDPAINEADPSTWEALKLVLTRDQYKPPEAIFRNSGWLYQFGHMYFRYFQDQFVLFGPGGSPTWIVPVVTGLFGAWINFERDRKSFFLLFTLFLITGPFMVYYLNFKENEVRERDYFFVANFHFYTIWIGMGAAAAVHELAGLFRRGASNAAPRPLVAAMAGLFIVMSVLPLAAGEGNNNFFRHNRRGNYVAHGYGYNMLIGMEPDAILFTNGDNDTFPLWYLQEVEGVRKDVRVVNLSLLQTDWYIKQLRDYEPKVPITLNDRQIEGLTPVRERDGTVLMVNDIMVDHIVNANDWKRPIYFAVTVPDQRHYADNLKMEGLVLRVYKESVDMPIDTVRLDENLNRKYHYRGFLTADGRWDDSVYKDDQATKLLQNYAAARVRLALGLYEQGRDAEARAELDKVRRFSGHFPGVDVALGMTYEQLGMSQEALSYYQELLQRRPDDADLLAALGHTHYALGDSNAAIDALRRSITLAPANFTPYRELINIYQARGDYGTLVELLEAWLRIKPDDAPVRNYLNAIRGRVTPGGGVP